MDIARKSRLQSPSPITPITAFWLFLCAHVVLWTLLPTLLAWNLPLDTIEALTWGREWQMGYYKHPPTSAWLAELFRWGALDWPLFLLSQLAIAAALWAAWELARDVLSPWMALVAVMALEGVNYYNLTGLEFNANVVQYPCWAIASLAFWRAVRRDDGGLGWWILLGVACGFGTLGKYSFLTLPASMVVALVLVPSLRAQWRRPGPWLAMGIAFAMFAPHLFWAQAHDWPTLRYAAGRATVATAATGAGAAAWVRIGGVASFVGAQLAAILPLVLLLWAASGWRKGDAGTATATETETAAESATGTATGRDASERRRDGWMLFAMGAGPLLIFLAAGVFGVRLHDMWGSPLFLVIGPAVAATWGMRLLHPRRFVFSFAAWTVLLVVLYGVIAIGGPLAKGKLSRIHYPGRELAAGVARGWHRAEGADARLPIVAGHAWPAGNVAQYLPSQPGGRPSVYIDADPERAAWLDDVAVRAGGAVFVWEAESGQVLEAPAAAPPAGWLERFPALKVQPPLEIAVRRFGRDFKVRVGWAILPPQPSPAAR